MHECRKESNASSLESPRQSRQVPGCEQACPDNEHDDDIGKHHGHDGTDPCTLVVLLCEPHHENKISIQWGDCIDGGIGDAISGEDRFGRNGEGHQQGNKDGSEQRPFSDRAGDQQVDQGNDHNEANQQKQGGEIRSRQDVGQLRAPGSCPCWSN